jgi:hypothetical protein
VVISPPLKGDQYPGLLPPFRDQWRNLAARTRATVIGVPLVIALLILLANVKAGLTLLVLFAGVEAASAVFVKNRTDRHNAAIGRGEIPRVPDPNFRSVDAIQLPVEVSARISRLGFPDDDIGTVLRFDGGWLVKHRNPRDVGVVAGDDGGAALFDPRRVTDLWAASEYLAGRGHEPAS